MEDSVTIRVFDVCAQQPVSAQQPESAQQPVPELSPSEAAAIASPWRLLNGGRGERPRSAEPLPWCR